MSMYLRNLPNRFNQINGLVGARQQLTTREINKKLLPNELHLGSFQVIVFNFIFNL